MLFSEDDSELEKLLGNALVTHILILKKMI